MLLLLRTGNILRSVRLSSTTRSRLVVPSSKLRRLGVSWICSCLGLIAWWTIVRIASFSTGWLSIEFIIIWWGWAHIILILRWQDMSLIVLPLILRVDHWVLLVQNHIVLMLPWWHLAVSSIFIIFGHIIFLVSMTSIFISWHPLRHLKDGEDYLRIKGEYSLDNEEDEMRSHLRSLRVIEEGWHLDCCISSWKILWYHH